MKQTIFKITLATLVVGLIMVSCTKKSNSPTSPTSPTETKTQLLTGKNWKITALTFNPGLDIGTGTLITDFYAYSMANGEACSLDNILNFNTNGNYTEYEGATLCDPQDPQLYGTGTWSFQNSETTLIRDGQESTIVTLNSTTLKLKDFEDFDGDGVKETEINVTYTKQ